MALDVRLSRTGAAPWGFRLVGGAEYNLPLTVAKVQMDGTAARAGVADGDRLLSIARQPAEGMTHEDAHRLITQAGDELSLGITRGLKQAPQSSASGFEPIPTTNMVPPSLPSEVSSVNRSLNASPFVIPVKPYRPFSTEPLDGIPPIEKPIILSPFYHDDFSRIKPKDFETPTKFKLEISKDYLPEGEIRITNESSSYDSQMVNEMSVTESYSKMLENTEELTSLEELNKEIDLQQIEDTAAFIVDDSLSKALTVSEEIKQEIDYEFKSVESKNSSEITQIVSEISGDSSKVSASLLAQLIDKTADEISKSNESKTSIFQEITSETKDKIDTTSIEDLKHISTEHNIISTESIEQKSKQTSEITHKEFSEQKMVENEQKSMETTDILCNESKMESYQFVDSTKQISQSKNLNSENFEESSQNNTAGMDSAQKQYAKSETINQNIENKKENTIPNSVESSQASESSQNTHTIIEGSTKSLTEIKQHAITTANLLAEQRAYTLGLQTIPNIQGHVHSSYHYDLLLKTFFIHLTDVMVALSRLIMAEGTSRSNSPMPPHKRDDDKEKLSQHILTKNSVQEQTSTDTQHHELRTQEGTQRMQISSEESNKMSADKFSQLRSIKTEEMTQKMDAVISEFRKNVQNDDEKTDENNGLARDVRGRSISKIEEEVLKENDPLEWLAKKDDNKFDVKQNLDNIEILTQTSQEAVSNKSEESDSNGKIIYVATVEEHHISQLDAIALENEMTTALKTSDISESKTQEATHNTISQVSESSNSQIAQKTVTSESSECSSVHETVHESRIAQQFVSEDSKLESLICQAKRESFSHEEVKTVSEHSEEIFTCQKVLKQEKNITNTENSRQSPPIITEERRQSLKSNSPKSESRKSSIIELNECQKPESVRKLELNTQISVKSDDSNNPDAIVPPTPLTDEYVFRLQIHLDECKSKSTTPMREPTPPDPLEHEDPYTVKKPKLIPHIDTTIEPVKYYVDPKKDLKSPGINDKSLPETPDTVGINEKMPFANSTDQNAFPGTIDQIPHIAADAIDKNVVPGRTANANDDNDILAFPGTVNKKALTADKKSTESERILKGIKNNAESCTSISHALTKMTEQISNIDSSASNNVTLSSATNFGVMASAPASASMIPVEDFPDILADERRKSSILTSAIDDTIKNIEQYKKEVGMTSNESVQSDHFMPQNINSDTFKTQNVTSDSFMTQNITSDNFMTQNITSDNFMTQNVRKMSQSHEIMYQNGDTWSQNVNEVTQNGDICNGYEMGLNGTTRGIVDGLENGGIIDEEMAKQLGKPGLTEQKIAELISGEAEMLKEAHVIGLKRVLSSHMNRLTEDDDSSVDFKKIKPQISALKDSEVIKALNEELTKSKEEKKKDERKWTTFLQRPARAVPRSRFGYVEREVEGEPYKIKIVKQPKPRVAPDYKPQDFETGPLPWEERAAREPPPPPVRPEDPILVPEAGPQYLEALDNLPESEVPDLEDTGILLPPEAPELPEQQQLETPSLDTADQEEEVNEEEEEEPTEETENELVDEQEMEQNKIAQQILEGIQSMVDPSASMEQQLMQMRAQLAALAQLPGVIHQTLELVTNQLGQLTRTTEESKQRVNEVECNGATVTEIHEEQISSSEMITEAVKTESQESNEAMTPADNQEQLQQQAEQPAQIATEPVVPEQTRRDDEAMLDEQGKVEKQKKELMSELQLEHQQRQVKQRPTARVGKPKPVFGPLVPQERPLVLPGGRRWRSAKDAYNEDFIKETLTAQAEIIQGKAKGVNFMKYEKPPKTMDYLKDSDVYKLVHNMDSTPGHQVDHLRPIVIAESEYRENTLPTIPTHSGQLAGTPTHIGQPAGTPTHNGQRAAVSALANQQVARYPTHIGQPAGIPIHIGQHAGAPTHANQQSNVMSQERTPTNFATELNVPVTKHIEQTQPTRPSSVAEAVEIVTTYVEVHSAATAC